MVMKILQDIIDNIKCDAAVKEFRRGIHWTAVVSRHCGLASTMMRDSCPDDRRDADTANTFAEQSALKLARSALMEDILEASLGLAAINSLTEIDESQCVEINAGDFLSKEGVDRNVAVIGHFPFTDDLRRTAKNLWVMDKWRRPGDYAEGDAEEYLPQSDIVAISSTTLINHTLSDLLKLCPRKSLKMLLGPTTPMTSVLFDFGIDIVSGSVVIDERGALRAIGEGANFRQLKRTGSVRLITMARTGILKGGLHR
jgi:uncharacterized protein